MARFINIAKDGTKPVLVNIEDIASVEETLPGMVLGQAEHSIRIVGMDGRDKAHLGCNGYNIDVDVAVTKLAAAGVELFALPLTYPKNDGSAQHYGRQFVNPAAFQYIITSESSVAKGDSLETSAMLLSLRGAFVESQHVPVTLVDDFLAKVEQVVLGVKHVDTNRMTARFYKMGRIAYNPAAITGIDPSGDHVDVKFPGAKIDFHAPRKDWVNEYLNRKCNNAPKEKRDNFMRAVWNNPAVDTNAHVYGFEKKIRDRIGREFARAVAADVPGLFKLDSDYGPVYNRFNDVARMSLSENIKEGHTYLHVQFLTRGNMDGVTATFKIREKAEREMNRLAVALSAPKP